MSYAVEWPSLNVYGKSVKQALPERINMSGTVVYTRYYGVSACWKQCECSHAGRIHLCSPDDRISSSRRYVVVTSML